MKRTWKILEAEKLILSDVQFCVMESLWNTMEWIPLKELGLFRKKKRKEQHAVRRLRKNMLVETEEQGGILVLRAKMSRNEYFERLRHVIAGWDGACGCIVCQLDRNGS
ncbi:MAG: hypothetical protein IJ468_13760 [Lachnospiraceae bacterium]|nr:hypothetical protein [Lachnospiraceae bacterium]